MIVASLQSWAYRGFATRDWDLVRGQLRAFLPVRRKRVKPPDGSSAPIKRSWPRSKGGKFTRRRVCSTVKPIANCAT